MMAMAVSEARGERKEWISILLVDDHVLLREGVRAVVETQDDIKIVGEAGSGEEALAEYRRLQPDIVLMDLQMGQMSGLEAIKAIRAEAPDAKILVLTTYSGDGRAMKASQLGAAG